MVKILFGDNQERKHPHGDSGTAVSVVQDRCDRADNRHSRLDPERDVVRTTPNGGALYL